MIDLEELKKIASANETCRLSEVVYTWFIREGYTKEPCRVERWFADDPSLDSCVVFFVGSELSSHYSWAEYGKTWHCEYIL